METVKTFGEKLPLTKLTTFGNKLELLNEAPLTPGPNIGFASSGINKNTGIPVVNRMGNVARRGAQPISGLMRTQVGTALTTPIHLGAFRFRQDKYYFLNLNTKLGFRLLNAEEALQRFLKYTAKLKRGKQQPVAFGRSRNESYQEVDYQTVLEELEADETSPEVETPVEEPSEINMSPLDRPPPDQDESAYELVIDTDKLGKLADVFREYGIALSNDQALWLFEGGIYKFLVLLRSSFPEFGIGFKRLQIKKAKNPRILSYYDDRTTPPPLAGIAKTSRKFPTFGEKGPQVPLPPAQAPQVPPPVPPPLPVEEAINSSFSGVFPPADVGTRDFLRSREEIEHDVLTFLNKFNFGITTHISQTTKARGRGVDFYNGISDFLGILDTVFTDRKTGTKFLWLSFEVVKPFDLPPCDPFNEQGNIEDFVCWINVIDSFVTEAARNNVGVMPYMILEEFIIEAGKRDEIRRKQQGSRQELGGIFNRGSTQGGPEAGEDARVMAFSGQESVKTSGILTEADPSKRSIAGSPTMTAERQGGSTAGYQRIARYQHGGETISTPGRLKSSLSDARITIGLRHATPKQITNMHKDVIKWFVKPGYLMYLAPQEYQNMQRRGGMTTHAIKSFAGQLASAGSQVPQPTL